MHIKKQQQREKGVCFWVILINTIFLLSSCELCSYTWSCDSTHVALVWKQKFDNEYMFTLGITSINAEDILHLEPPEPLDVSGPMGIISSPAWSPRGDLIAYYKVTSVLQNCNLNYEYDVELAVISPTEKQKKVLRQLKWKAESALSDTFISSQLRPAWSEDGNRVIYAKLLSDSEWLIKSVRLDGMEPRQHTHSSTGVVYTPKGRNHFCTFYGNELIVYEIDGGKAKFFLLPALSDSTDIAWTDEIAKLAFLAGEKITLLDVSSGKITEIHDSDVKSINGVDIASRHVFYLSQLKKDSEYKQKFDVRSVPVDGALKKILFSVPVQMTPIRLSVSPNGRFIFLIGDQKNEDYRNGSTLLIYDNETNKILTANLGFEI